MRFLRAEDEGEATSRLLEGGRRHRGAAAEGTPAAPLFSILIVAKDAGPMIGRAIESAVSQHDIPSEIIVLDAGSTDETVDVLRRHDADIEYWRSAPDDGPVAATNDGIFMSSGDIICFLNADDWLEPGALGPVAAAFRRYPDTDIVTASTRFVAVADDDTVRTIWHQPSRASRLGWKVILDGSPVINARFFRRRVFERVGVFRDAIVNPNDREFLVRCLLSGIRERCISDLAYSYRIHEGSNSLSSNSDKLLEFRRDHVRLAERLLDSGDLSASVARRMRRWRSRELAHLMILEGHQGRWHGALDAWREGSAKDGLFWLALIAKATVLGGFWLRGKWRRRWPATSP